MGLWLLFALHMSKYEPNKNCQLKSHVFTGIEAKFTENLLLLRLKDDDFTLINDLNMHNY